jgi:hypothetical protein
LHTFTDTTVNILLPILILITSFLLKMTINRNFNWEGFLDEWIKFPSDIVFLSISFVTTYILTDGSNFKSGTVYLFILIVTTILTFAFAKKATDLFGNVNGRRWKSIVWFNIVSYIFAIPTILISIQLMLTGVNSNG